MEFGAKEIMIALGMLVFIAIVLDIVRRIRASRYENIRMPRRKQPHFDCGDGDEFGSELPGGGARVVSYRDVDEIEQVKQNVQKVREQGKPVLKTFEKVNNNTPAESVTNASTGEPVEQYPDDAPTPENDVSHAEPGVTNKPIAADKLKTSTPKPKTQSKKPTSLSPQGSLNLDEEDEQDVSLVIALHLKAQLEETFSGIDLKNALLESGMRYGAMKIFHRHQDESGAGPVMFSVANLIKPGTFDLNAMEDFATPGITFFFDAAEAEKPMECFDLLLETAKQLAETLDGELKDEMRSDLTRQTIEHYRQKINDFLRAKRLGVS